MKKVLKVIGIILLIILVIAFLIYKFVLMYPKLNSSPKIGKWYKITNKEMLTANGHQYKAFFKKGKEKKVLIYFAGGGSNIDEYTAQNKLFNDDVIGIDYLSNLTMNMGGIASPSDQNPFSDWTVIAFPCATGDFMTGTGEFKYKDEDGKEHTLYHHGYTNYTMIMKEIMDKVDLKDTDTVLVTGYSAGGFSAVMLAEDIYTNYFPNVKNKNVLIDASLLLYDGWKDVVDNVWHSPKSISDKVKTDDLTLDMITSLREKYGNDINIMFDSSTRDGDLAKTQNYYNGGKFEVDEDIADMYQQMLKEEIPKFKETETYLFIWDGLQYYDDTRNMTMHTIIAVPYVFQKFDGINKSISEWVIDTINGNPKDYGLDLVNKEYPKTKK